MALLDVAGWSRQDFAVRWKTLLPCLILNIDEDKDSVADSLKIIYTSIVPVIPVSDLEEIIFSSVCEKTKNRFVAILDSLVQILGIHHEAEDVEDGAVSSELNTLLQVLTGIVASVAACVEYVSSFENGLFLENIRSLPRCVLKLMVQSFAHCRDSGPLYGRFFARVSDRLSGLFKATRQLQFSFSTLLEGLKIIDPTEEEIGDLCDVIQKLCKICETVSDLDVKIMVALWKTVSRLSCQYRDILVHQLNIESLLKQLCQYISSSCECFSQTENTVLPRDNGSQGKIIKIIGFQMRVLVTLIKEYHDHLEDVNILPIFQLIIQIKSFLPPSLAARNLALEVNEELVRHVGIGLEPLIASLVDHSGFLAISLDPDFSLNDFHGVGISRMMTLLTVAQLLPSQPDEIQSLWLVPENNPGGKPLQSVIDAIFSSISNCYVELCVPVSLPNLIKNGAPRVQMSLYEYLVTRLCTFVVTFPAEHFSVLENSLLRNVLSRRQHCAMVAIDVWCFLARCGSADLCRDHCTFLALLFNESRSNSSAECCHLVLLIRRLFRLVAPEHQTELISKFTGSEVVSILQFDVPTVSNGQTIIDGTMHDFAKSVEHWTSSVIKTVTDAKSLALQLSTLVNICRSSVLIDDSFNMTQQCDLASQCLTLLSVLPPGDSTDAHRHLFRRIVSAVLFLLSHLATNLGNRSIVVLLQFCECLLSSCEDVIKLSILEVLGQLAAKTFEPDSEQCQVFRIIPKLFSALLDDENIMVCQIALETFKNFAKKTSHVTLVPESLGNDKIRQKFMKYMQQQTARLQKSEVDLEFLRMQCSAVDKWSLLPHKEILVRDESLRLGKNDSKISDRVEPPLPKRSRITEEESTNSFDEQGNQSLQAALDELDKCITEIERVARLRSLPSWGAHRLTEMKKRLDSLL